MDTAIAINGYKVCGALTGRPPVHDTATISLTSNAVNVTVQNMSDFRSMTLMLTAGYEPLKIIPWQRAVQLLYLDKVEVVSEYEDVLRSTTQTINVPSVVRLKRGFKRQIKAVKFSRSNVYGRDGYICQFCGVKKGPDELTYDHVVPRSQGGRTTWTNIVTACSRCNSRKGGRTPEQAGMKLLKKPVQPKALPYSHLNLTGKKTPEAWLDYMYWNVELEA